MTAPIQGQGMPGCQARCVAAVRWPALPNGQVRLPEILVLEQVSGLALEDDTTGREHVAAIGDRERHIRVLLDHEHRDAGLVHLLDDLEAPLHQDGRETHRRLVHQQQPRLRHERPAHGDHLLLAAGERPRELRAPLVEEREERVHALELLPEVRPWAQVRPHLEVLEHRHRAEQAPILRHDREPAPDPVRRRHPRDVLAREPHRARARPDEAEDRLQRRRLPRRVPAEEADELALATTRFESWRMWICP